MRSRIIYNKVNGWSDHIASDQQAAQYLPVDTDTWNGSQWIIYYENLLLMYGANYAKNIFNQDIKNVGYDAVIFLSGAFDCEFLKYTNQRGLINYGGITGNLYCGTSSVVTNVGDAAVTISSLIKPAAILLFAFGSLYVYNNYVKNKPKK